MMLIFVILCCLFLCDGDQVLQWHWLVYIDNAYVARLDDGQWKILVEESWVGGSPSMRVYQQVKQKINVLSGWTLSGSILEDKELQKSHFYLYLNPTEFDAVLHAMEKFDNLGKLTEIFGKE